MARDSYSRELADRICALMAAGRSVASICSAPGMPRASTVRGWVSRDRDGFAARYRAVTLCKWRDSPYSAAMAGYICDELSAGRPLREICRGEGMPAHSTVLRWAQADHNGFAADYRLAREFGYFTMLDEMQAIADDERGDIRLDSRGQPVPNPANVTRARLRLATRRQLLSQSLPKTGARLLDQGAVPARETLAAVTAEIARRKLGGA